MTQRINSDLANDFRNLLNRNYRNAKKIFCFESGFGEKRRGMLRYRSTNAVGRNTENIENRMNEYQFSEALKEILEIYRKAEYT